MKNSAIFEEEEEEEDQEDDDHHTLDDNSSCYSNGVAAVTAHDSRNETMLLAQFFSTTGPEEYVAKQDNKTQQQFKRASRLLSRLRKKPTISALRSGSTLTEPKKTHIPLPAYESLENVTPTIKTSFTKETKSPPTHLRDSGIYSETASERDSSVSSHNYTNIPPLPAFLTDLQQFPQPPFSYKNYPRRPAPLPPAIASAAIASACSSTTTIRSVPEAALRRRSVRLRHVQVQTDSEQETIQTDDKKACPHCRQVVRKDSIRTRRPSCPPALSSGPILTTTAYEKEGDTKALLAMVMKLKSQLAEEKQSRIKLENAMSKDKKVELAKEKDKWAGDCLWLNDRIALLPE